MQSGPHLAVIRWQHFTLGDGHKLLIGARREFMSGVSSPEPASCAAPCVMLGLWLVPLVRCHHTLQTAMCSTYIYLFVASILGTNYGCVSCLALKPSCMCVPAC
jgi:hypothetical protein